jgi:hypothetical protein
MKTDERWLMFLLKRVWLTVRGLIHFGPGFTYRAQKLMSMTFDAFEELYERLPNQKEQLQIVRKLAWFHEHHDRLPTQEETKQIVQQVEMH